MLWLLLQVASAPPMPPPPADRMAAAVRLWNEHPLSEAERQTALQGAVWGYAYSALDAVGIELGDRRWNEKFEVLRARLTARLPADMSGVERQVTTCLAQRIAEALSVEEIEELRRYAATSGGEKFWRMAHWNSEPIRSCYTLALQIRVSGDDYRAAGLKPPKANRNTNIVS